LDQGKPFRTWGLLMAKEYKTHVLLSARKAAEQHENMTRDRCVDVSYPGFVQQAVDFEIGKLEEEGWHAESIFSHRNTIYVRCWKED